MSYHYPPHHQRTPCPHCYTRGSFDTRTNSPVPGDGICKSCKGSSKSGWGAYKGTCKACFQVYSDYYKSDRGSGKCNACKGTGWV